MLFWFQKTCDFIEEEAEVSIHENSISTDEFDDDGSFDESFIDDKTQDMENITQVQKNYLQSIR